MNNSERNPAVPASPITPLVASSGRFKRFGPLALILLGALIFIGIATCLGEEYKKPMISDSGLVQIFGLTMISLASLTAFTLGFRHPFARRFYWALGFILLIYALREGDVHKLVSHYSHVTKKKFYFDSRIPVMTRLICGLVMGGFLVTFLRFVAKGTRPLLQGLKARRIWAIHVFAWGAVFFFSQVVDKSPLNNFYLGGVIEETAEAIAEAIMFYAVRAFRYRPVKGAG